MLDKKRADEVANTFLELFKLLDSLENRELNELVQLTAYTNVMGPVFDPAKYLTTNAYEADNATGRLAQALIDLKALVSELKERCKGANASS